MVGASDANVRFLSPCDASGAGYYGSQLADVNDDRLDDFITWSIYCDELAMHVSLAPFSTDMDLSTSSFLWLPGVEKPNTHVDFAGGTDVTGDGTADWVAVAGAGDGSKYPITAWLYSGPMVGTERPDTATALVESIPPNPDYSRRDLDVVLVEGDPGTVVLMGTYWSDPDGMVFTQAWALSGDRSGAFGTNDLAWFDGLAGGVSSSEAAWQAVGDVDGDGCSDLLRIDDYTADVFLGPIDASSGPIRPDLLLGHDHGHSSEIPEYASATAADLDDDGRSDILISGFVYVSADAEWEGRLFRSTFASGDLRLDEGVPLITAGAGSGGTGFALASLDANGDTAPDVAIFAPYDDGAVGPVGSAYLEYGPFSGTRDLGTGGAILQGASDLRGWAQRLDGGDTNADGFDDLLVGSGQGFVVAAGAPVDWVFLGGP